MLIEQIIEFELRGTWVPWPYMYSYNCLISWQNKNLKEKFSSGSLFTAKILQKAVRLISLYLGQITQNLTSKHTFMNVFYT